jgi:tetratricopeptide (TPR) repeat protein
LLFTVFIILKDFYQGNQKFREAKFDDAKQSYHNSLDKLKHWNELIHSVMPSSEMERTRTSSGGTATMEHPSTSPHSERPPSGTTPRPRDGSSTPAIETIRTHHEAIAMTNLGVLQFAEGCYKESQDIMKKALEKHQEINKQLQQSNSASLTTTATTTTGELPVESLTALCIQIKKDLSLLPPNASSSTPNRKGSSGSNAPERLLVSQLNEYSTLDAMIADLLNNLAACHEVIGELTDAEKFFEESLQLRMVRNLSYCINVSLLFSLIVIQIDCLRKRIPESRRNHAKPRHDPRCTTEISTSREIFERSVAN